MLPPASSAWNHSPPAHHRRCKTLVNEFISSRIDYCNSLYYGLTDTIHNKLQSILNAVARMVSGLRKFDHISGTLRDLHWLPASQRNVYKIGSITRRCLHGVGPAHLKEYLIPVSTVSGRSHLRSAHRGDLTIPRARTVRAGGCSYRTSGPTVWNSLPHTQRNPDISDMKFASELKTHLFM